MTYLTTSLTDQKTNISFQKTTVTSHQDVTTSWTLIEGGQMSYTPSSSSAEIMVEFTTSFGRKDGVVSLLTRLQVGDTVGTLGDVVTDNIDYYNGFGGSRSASWATNVSDIITLKYKLAGWSGSKIIQVQCTVFNNNSGMESIVNGTRALSTTDVKLFNPFMKIYEL